MAKQSSASPPMSPSGPGFLPERPGVERDGPVKVERGTGTGIGLTWRGLVGGCVLDAFFSFWSPQRRGEGGGTSRASPDGRNSSPTLRLSYL